MEKRLNPIAPRRLLFGVAPPGFIEDPGRIPIPDLVRRSASAMPADAEAALRESPLSLEASAILLGCRYAPPLEVVLRRAREVTDKVFGRSVLLYAPCYVSSFCVNHCRYCGYNFTMSIPRWFLTPMEVAREMKLLAAQGIRRGLLVAGDYPTMTTAGYMETVISLAKGFADEIDLEVAPASTETYGRWSDAGAGGVVCYQETYDAARYAALHPRGPKRSYAFRLGTLERAGAAGMKRLGLGLLLGLSDPTPDLLALIAHARYLERIFPGAQISMSLPRLRPAVPSFHASYAVDGTSLLRFFAVLRLAVPRAVLVVSTRETAVMRRRLLEAGITQMSAGSVTVPGGYGDAQRRGRQFDTADRRSVAEVVEDLEDLGYTVRWTAGGARPPSGTLAPS